MAEREARDASQDARAVTLGMLPCFLSSRFPTAFPRIPDCCVLGDGDGGLGCVKSGEPCTVR